MTFQPTRPAVLLAGLVFAFAAGCGKSDPAKLTEKPADSKPVAPTPTPDGPPPVVSVPPTPVDPKGPAQTAAETFVKELRDQTVAVARLSPAFLKVIGKPLLSDSDKAAGASAGEAQAWLRRAGAIPTGVGLPNGSATPAAAVFTASFTGATVADGRVLLRLVPADGGWKVDWFQLGTAKTAEPPKATAPDEPFQEFAAQAFLDALTAGPVVVKDDRVRLLGALLAPPLRAAWADPFGGDKDRGYDYSPTKLGAKADELGTGVTAVARTRTGPDAYRVELAKGGAATAYTLKLVRGAAAGEWLVGEFTPQ